MKAHLMFADADFDLAGELPCNVCDLERDLGLPTVYAAMARGDKLLYDIARHGVLSELTDPAAIAYRQCILRDCLAAPEVTRALYKIAVEAVERERTFWMGIFSRYPTTVLHRSVDVMQMFVEVLHRLRGVAEAHRGRFDSDGMRRFCDMLIGQLSDDYFAEVQAHLRALKFRDGVLLSVRIGRGNKGSRYVLRTPVVTRHRLGDLLHGRSKLSFTLPERDEAGHQALGQLRDRGINLIANAVAQATDHILSFFRMLRVELGFYVGCLNLHEALQAKGSASCEPEPLPAGSGPTVTGLYDVALALAVEAPVVGNDVSADGTDLIVITGANMGGKSTFLRSIGLGQLMMQAGMFVPATAFRAGIATGVFTHFKREEDATMRSGKLDEEMARMSDIADHIRPGGLLLCNESFASTNEARGLGDLSADRPCASGFRGAGLFRHAPVRPVRRVVPAAAGRHPVPVRIAGLAGPPLLPAGARRTAAHQFRSRCVCAGLRPAAGVSKRVGGVAATVTARRRRRPGRQPVLDGRRCGWVVFEVSAAARRQPAWCGP